MKITISGSIAFYDQMQQLKKELESFGHTVHAPVDNPSAQPPTISEKKELMQDHLQKIEWADCLIVYNHEKKNIPGYIGPNTLIEMGIAFYLHKQIYLIFSIPNISYVDEVKAMQPIILYNNINNLL